jgi:hypothetical protein
MRPLADDFHRDAKWSAMGRDWGSTAGALSGESCAADRRSRGRSRAQSDPPSAGRRPSISASSPALPLGFAPAATRDRATVGEADAPLPGFAGRTPHVDGRAGVSRAGCVAAGPVADASEALISRLTVLRPRRNGESSARHRAERRRLTNLLPAPRCSRFCKYCDPTAHWTRYKSRFTDCASQYSLALVCFLIRGGIHFFNASP